MDDIKTSYMEAKCLEFRRELIQLLHGIQTGHPGGSLSVMEILVKLYYDRLRIDPANPQWEDRDRFILGKGHAAPALYMILADLGFFDKEELKTLRQANSRLQGHPCAVKTPGIEASTGPLGLGISFGVGVACSAKQDKKSYKTYVVLGDGEIQEGIVWEAAMAASKFKLDNLVAILDNNGVQLDGTVEEILPMGDISAKWEAFGWHVIEADGHDLDDLDRALSEADWVVGKPVLINAKTVKGKGVSFMEGKNIWHGKPIDKQEFSLAMEELGGFDYEC
ncbi:transketolase [Clostridiales bacterium F-3ap]|uniref:Transketolase n=2 Tax=Anaerotalea alkaliphila TaxID=2662126 RepID=A0A7X5KP63_9FIRM|nr:transketolase [Anaerotalea alkaliphila]NDL68744.1 transketolase [Anaerotalea alkaliphila]